MLRVQSKLKLITHHAYLREAATLALLLGIGTARLRFLCGAKYKCFQEVKARGESGFRTLSCERNYIVCNAAIERRSVSGPLKDAVPTEAGSAKERSMSSRPVFSRSCLAACVQAHRTAQYGQVETEVR